MKKPEPLSDLAKGLGVKRLGDYGITVSYKNTEKKKTFIQQVKEFYPSYLQDHKHPFNKLVHVLGNIFIVSLAIGIISEVIISSRFWGLLILPFLLTYGIYAFVWPSHLLIEKNKPATFRVSRWITKACDWIMLYQLLTGKLRWEGREVVILSNQMLEDMTHFHHLSKKEMIAVFKDKKVVITK